MSAAEHEVNDALAAARKATSVHYVLKRSLEGGGTATTVGDVSSTAGRQAIDSSDGGHLLTLLVDGRAYFLGNVKGLSGAGMRPSDAKQLASHWRVVPSGSPLFPAVVDQVTLASVLRYVIPRPPVVEEQSSRHFGQEVIAVRGGKPEALSGNPKASGQSVLYLAAATHLPIAYDYTPTGASAPERWRFSRWGEEIRVTAPRLTSNRS